MMEYIVLSVIKGGMCSLCFGMTMFDSLKFFKKQRHLNPFMNLALNHTELTACHSNTELLWNRRLRLETGRRLHGRDHREPRLLEHCLHLSFGML